jgi:hypothetical protein
LGTLSLNANNIRNNLRDLFDRYIKGDLVFPIKNIQNLVEFSGKATEIGGNNSWLYRGDFIDGKYQGYGTRITSNGTIYE